MIAKLTGTILYRGQAFLLIDQGPIAYKVIVPEPAVAEFRGEVTMFTHEVIRDDQRELFGFKSIEALELFWSLTTVSGVGPRSAQKIAYAGGVMDVKRKIMAGDLDFLTSVQGIGKKTAQKIILELKGVLVEESPASGEDADAIEGLVGLGYSRRQAEEALAAIGDTVKGTDARIRAALKRLAR